MTTEALAKAVVALRFDDLPAATRRNARQCFLDWLACCVIGSAQPPAKIMRDVLAADGGTGRAATVFCAKPYRAAESVAALANGAASHALDMDDLHNTSIIHLGTVVIPAAVAVAERQGVGGKALIEAIVAGYEVAARVGEAVNPESYFFWHTTATAGTFGAAAAVAKLLGLDAGKTVACLGSAGSQAAGLWEFLVDGAMSKTLHAGKAAQNGILSGYLARAGFTAATKILEGEKGFCRAMLSAPHLEKLTEGLGEGFKIDTNGFKAYTCCRHTHAANNAAIDLKSEHRLDPARVTSVVVKTNQVARDLVDNPTPQTVYGHKFSMQYCVAAALLWDRVGLDEFLPEATANPAARRLMGTVKVVVDPALHEEFVRDPTKWAAEVIIETADGGRFAKTVPYPKGDPMNPLTYAETEAKFRRVAGQILAAREVERLLVLSATLDSVPDLAAALAFLSDATVAA
jgi:2-methylcitrate dehydratase PrpD